MGIKQYFTKNEVEQFIARSELYKETDFDIDISYEIIQPLF